MKYFKWLVFLPLLLAFITVVYAQDTGVEVSDDDVNRVARELYCPICENTPLDVCETQACEDWRELIRGKLAVGQSDQQIIEYFAEIYGERARATPATRGWSLVVWVAPLIGAVVGVVYFARLLRRWLAQGAETAPLSSSRPSPREKDDPGIDDYVARLEREIHKSS